MQRNLQLKENIKTDFSVSHSVTTSWSMKDFHFHDVFEIYYTKTQGVKYFVNDTMYETIGRDLFVFNNSDLHKSFVLEDLTYERYLVLFRHEYVLETFSNGTDLLECFLSRSKNFNHHIILSAEQAQALEDMLKKAKYYCDNQVYGSDVYKIISLAEILLFVNQTFNSLSDLKNNSQYHCLIKELGLSSSTYG